MYTSQTIEKSTKNKPAASKGLGSSEAQIKKLVDEFHQAILDQNVDKVMSFYADDVVAFDAMGPLEYIGKEAYRQSWEEAFSHTAEKNKNDSGYDIHQLKIVADENVAFAFSLNHCYGPQSDGTEMDMWMRATQGFKKINGKWLIFHEQYSVPTDFETGKALLSLKPETSLH